MLHTCALDAIVFELQIAGENRMHAFDIEFALKFGRCAGVTTTSTGIKTDVDVVKATSNSALEVFERSEPFRQPSEPTSVRIGG